MMIRLNGEENEIPEGSSVASLLEALGIKPQGIAVELNREIVPRRAHGSTTLKHGDTVEIVRMVGGG